MRSPDLYVCSDLQPVCTSLSFSFALFCLCEGQGCEGHQASRDPIPEEVMLSAPFFHNILFMFDRALSDKWLPYGEKKKLWCFSTMRAGQSRVTLGNYFIDKT